MKEKFDRKQGIGGSDATRLYNGDWHDLYLEKIGEKEPDDLYVPSTNSDGEVEMVRDPFSLVIQVEEKKEIVQKTELEKPEEVVREEKKVAEVAIVYKVQIGTYLQSFRQFSLVILGPCLMDPASIRILGPT